MPNPLLFFFFYCLFLACTLEGKTPFDLQYRMKADILCWQAKQFGIQYTTSPESVYTTDDFSLGSTKEPCFEWNAGLRLSLEGSSPCSTWNGMLKLTYYKGLSHGHTTANDDQGIFPLLSFSPETFSTDYAEEADVHTRSIVTLVDALGVYCPWRWGCASISPTIALRYACLRQNIHGSYQGGSYSAGSDKVTLRGDFYGIGPRAGLNGALLLSHGFRIYAEAAASLLCGKFDVSQEEEFLTVTRASLKRNKQSTRWNIDLSAGIDCVQCPSPCACFERYSFGIGGDLLYFNRQYPFKHGPEFSVPHKDHSLLLYGLHLSAQIDF